MTEGDMTLVVSRHLKSLLGALGAEVIMALEEMYSEPLKGRMVGIDALSAGAYVPSLLEPPRRAEKARHSVVVEAYVPGSARCSNGTPSPGNSLPSMRTPPYPDRSLTARGWSSWAAR